METRTIKTKAELKRLPIGTDLILINSLMGPCHTPRKIFKVMSNQIVMELPDGRTSHLYLDGGVKLEPTPDGFLMRCTDDERIAAQYIVLAEVKAAA